MVRGRLVRWLLVLVVLAVIPLTAGCGSAGNSASVPCVSVPLVGSDQRLLVPPPPRIVRARQRGQRMYVDVEIPSTPGACKPIGYIVAVVSTADGSNRSIEPGNNTGSWMPLHAHQLHLVLRRPILEILH